MTLLGPLNLRRNRLKRGEHLGTLKPKHMLPRSEILSAGSIERGKKNGPEKSKKQLGSQKKKHPDKNGAEVFDEFIISSVRKNN